MADLEQELELATSKKELVTIARRLQVKVPERVTFVALKAALTTLVKGREVHTEAMCECNHLIRSHYLNNSTGEAFECKVPTCECKKFEVR